MSNPFTQQHDGGRGAEHPPHGPRWKRMHHSAFFWVAAVSLLAVMVVYVMTSNLSVWPGQEPQPSVPALAP
jgi:hypothetical protein